MSTLPSGRSVSVPSFFFPQHSRAHQYLVPGNSSPITSGLPAYASFFVDINGLEKYKAFFIILGIPTGVLALAVFFLFPDGPRNAWFLTKRQRVQPVYRKASKQTRYREQVLEGKAIHRGSYRLEDLGLCLARSLARARQWIRITGLDHYQVFWVYDPAHYLTRLHQWRGECRLDSDVCHRARLFRRLPRLDVLHYVYPVSVKISAQ